MAAPPEEVKTPEDFEAYLRIAKYPLVKFTGEHLFSLNFETIRFSSMLSTPW